MTNWLVSALLQEVLLCDYRTSFLTFIASGNDLRGLKGKGPASLTARQTFISKSPCENTL